MNQDSIFASEGLQKHLISVGIAAWRTARLCARVISRLDAGEGPRYASQLRYLEKRAVEALEEAGLTVVSVEGEVFDSGMAVSVVNVEDFGVEVELVVDQMVEPIIMGPDGLLHAGIVTVRRAHS